MPSVLVEITGSKLVSGGREFSGRICGKTYTIVMPATTAAVLPKATLRAMAAGKLARAWSEQNDDAFTGVVEVNLP